MIRSNDKNHYDGTNANANSRSTGNISWSDGYGISIERKGRKGPPSRSLSPRATPPESMPVSDLLKQTSVHAHQDQRSQTRKSTTEAHYGKSYAYSARNSASETSLAFRTYRGEGSRTEIPEKELFASCTKLLEDGEDDSYSAGNMSSSTTTSGSADSFGIDDEEDIASQLTARNRNISDRNLRSFLETNERSLDIFDDDEVSRDCLSMSIMSMNSAPFAIREERSGEEQEEDPDLSSSLRRSLRPSFTSAVVSTPAAYLSLLDEYEKLFDQHEDLAQVQERRKSEKNQLTSLLMSKEEEYVERRDRLEKLQGRLEASELELMNETSKSTIKFTRAMHPLRTKQKEAWEDLDLAVSQLDLLRSENKRLLEKLHAPAEVTHIEVQMQLDLTRRYKKVQELEERLQTLKEDVSRIRGRKKAFQPVVPALIGQEIIWDEKDQASLTSITVNS